MFLLKLLADYESFVTDLINCASKVKMTVKVRCCV